PGGGIPGDLPGQRLGCAALAGYPPVPLAFLPGRVRGRPDQASRRPVLARAGVHAVAPRDAAPPEPAPLVVPSPPACVAPLRGRGQLRGSADPAVRALPAAAVCVAGRAPHDRDAAEIGRA